MGLDMIRQMEKEILEASEAYEEAYEAFQLTCPHNDVLEGEYESDYLSTWPDFRVCKDCGFVEEGWGIGYHVLRDGEGVTPTTRDHAKKVRRGMPSGGTRLASSDYKAKKEYVKKRKDALEK